MKKVDQEIQSLLKAMIGKREQSMRSGDSSLNDFLGILVDSKSKKSEIRENNNVGMSTRDVIEECKLFYFAGSETTSVLLAWTMVMLGKHQEWQERAREEVRQIFGDSKPDFDGFSRLKVVSKAFRSKLGMFFLQSHFRTVFFPREISF